MGYSNMRWTILLFLTFSVSAFAQNAVVSGRVQDATGEILPLAHLIINSTSKIVITTTEGDFTFSHPHGPLSIEVRYTGYQSSRTSFVLSQDTTVLFTLALANKQLKEVVITGAPVLQSDQLHATRSSTLTITEKEINSIPVLGGEADLIKTIQLLPGVSKGVEGTTDLFVRGGAADQNLVLLDGAPIYNTGHLFGFLSVFNPDILEGVESINGAFPAQYGGRLSSILNVNTKSRFAEQTKVNGNIGLLASRLMVRQPLVKNKLEIWAAGRRTYVDQVVRLTGETLPYYFYDFNTKLIYQPSSRDRLELTHYSGTDILNFVRTGRDTASNFRFTSDFKIANSSQTFRWERTLREGFNSSVRLYRTQFRYFIENQFEESRLFTNSNITDYGATWMVQKKSSDFLSWTSGIDLVHHNVSPNVISTSGEISQLVESSATTAQTSTETSAYLQADGNLSNRWNSSAGLRLSSAAVQNSFYVNPEPRVALRYKLSNESALKFSYSRMAQYLHRVSSAAVAFPTDIWYPVTDKVSPQTADQFTLAFNQHLPRQQLFISVETYYKNMDKLIGYREGTNLFLNTDFENQLIQGKGRAYGLEILIKKESGKLTGWISYTLSKSLRQYDEINNGEWFFARYDRRHNGAVVANYQLTPRWSVSGVFEFISGSRFTPIIGQYIVPSPSLGGVQLIPVYAPLNSVKLADSHRLDVGIKYQSTTTKRFRSEWFAGVYNTYNRATPIGIGIQANPDGSYQYQQPGLFGLLPFVSYGFKF